MRILTELIDSLRGKDHPVKEVLTGAYWTAVVSRGCGLASTFRDEGHPHGPLLFDCGIQGLSGTIVVDPREAFRFISQGATYQEIRGVRRVTMLKD